MFKQQQQQQQQQHNNRLLKLSRFQTKFKTTTFNIDDFPLI